MHTYFDRSAWAFQNAAHNEALPPAQRSFLTAAAVHACQSLMLGQFFQRREVALFCHQVGGVACPALAHRPAGGHGDAQRTVDRRDAPDA